MAKREVVEVICDRCGRPEIQTKTEHVVEGPEFTGTLQTPGLPKLPVNFTDLCRKCRTTVRNYFTRIAKVSDSENEEDEEPTKSPVAPEHRNVIPPKKN